VALLISVVDDDGASRAAVTGLLRSMGHDAVGFASAAEFLASDELGRTGLLIADQRMPEITGLDLRRRLLAVGASIPMALMTAYPTEAARRQALASGIFSYLTKPISPGDLTACIAAAQCGPLR